MNKILKIPGFEPGRFVNCKIRVNKYINNDSLAVSLYTEDGIPFTILTKNFPESGELPENEAYYDDNNNYDEIFDTLKEEGLVEWTDEYLCSGFCLYPKVRFNLEKMEQYT